MTVSGVAQTPGLDDDPDRWEPLLDAAEAARLRGDYRAGAALARRAEVLAGVLGDRAGGARALQSLATQLLRLGEYEDAITCCRDAIELLRTEGDDAGVGHVLTLQAMAWNALGLHEESLDALTRAREIAQRLGDTGLLYWVHNRIGTVHTSMGNQVQGNIYLLHALTMTNKLDHDARFCVLNNLGDNAVGLVPMLREQGEAGLARQTLVDGLGYVQEALALARAADHPFREAIAIDNYGMLLALRGDRVEALAAIEHSHTLAVAHGYRSLQVAALEHAAHVRLLGGDAPAAIEGLLEALARAVEAGEKPMAMGVHHRLSEAYQMVGDLAAALYHYRRYHQLEREAHSEVAATRARMMIHHFELDNARLEADNARLEAELHRMRSQELEADNSALERRTRELDRRTREDALTGLANRRQVESRLPEMVATAAARGEPICVAIADVDEFKAVNDRFGHPVGDDVLRSVADVLRRHTRPMDLVARLGGEEFLVALSGVDLVDAHQKCELLRSWVADFPWEALAPGLRVTISIGVVDRCGATDHRELLSLADARLYDAKRNGRNRVESGKAP